MVTSGRREKYLGAGGCPEGRHRPIQHLLGQPLFSVYGVQCGAVGRAQESDSPAAALELEASGSASQGLNHLICEMEMVILRPCCDGTGGKETLYCNFLTEPGVKQVPNKC